MRSNQSVADLEGTGDARHLSPIFSCSSRQKIVPNNRLASPLWEWRPLGNPAPVTVSIDRENAKDALYKSTILTNHGNLFSSASI